MDNARTVADRPGNHRPVRNKLQLQSTKAAKLNGVNHLKTGWIRMCGSWALIRSMVWIALLRSVDMPGDKRSTSIKTMMIKISENDNKFRVRIARTNDTSKTTSSNKSIKPRFIIDSSFRVTVSLTQASLSAIYLILILNRIGIGCKSGFSPNKR